MSLKNKTISAVGWNGLGNVARQVLQVISMVVMARFLSPDDFGVYAILMIFVTFMQILGMMGTAQVIVHLDNPDQRLLSSVFYFNLFLGLFFFLVLYGLAWPLADFFDNPQLTHLLQIMGATFIITSFGLVQKALLEKSLLFKRVVIVETLALAVASIVGIAAAFIGLGVYSLLVQSLLNAGGLALGFWLYSDWRPKWIFSFEDIKKIWSYTVNLTGFNIINYFSRNADNFLIGKFIGSSALGMYSIAYRIMLYPLDNVSRVLVRVLFPAFSHLKYDNERFKKGYLKSISFISFVTFPLMAGLFAVSEAFVTVVFGDKWVGMSSLLMILAPIGMIQSIVTTVGSIYTAKGTTGLMFKIGAINSIVTVLSFVIGLHYGVNGIAFCYGIANLIMFYPNIKLSWDQIELGVVEGLNILAPFFVSAIIMCSALYFQGIWIRKILPNLFIFLLIEAVFGMFIYLSLIFFINKEFILSLIDEFNLRNLKKQTTGVDNI